MLVYTAELSTIASSPSGFVQLKSMSGRESAYNHEMYQEAKVHIPDQEVSLSKTLLEKGGRLEIDSHDKRPSRPTATALSYW